jgi:serralysin
LFQSSGDPKVTETRIDGGSGDDTLIGDDGDNLIHGHGGDDILIGLGENDRLFGSRGNDILDGGDGNDDLIGYSGSNTATYEHATSGVTVDALIGEWQDTIGAGIDRLSHIQILVGSSYDDTLTGKVLFGGNGDDLLIGGAKFDGGDGADTASFDRPNTHGVTVDLAIAGLQDTGGPVKVSLRNIENLRGTFRGDTLTGNGISNVISGSLGSDVLNGGGGDDTLDGGEDNDTASYANTASGVRVDLTISTLQDTAGAGSDILIAIENLRGSSFDDILIGDSGKNVLLGRGGDDTLNGGAGTDTLDGGGGAGSDTASYVGASSGVRVSLAILTSQNTLAAGRDTLVDIENLKGSAYRDHLTGDGSDNVIAGRSGKDTLTGGAGKDTYVFDARLGADNIDTLVGYSAADDTINLDNKIFTSLSTVGTLAETAFHIGAQASDASDRIIYNFTTGALLYDADGTGAGTAIQFAKISTGLALTNDDFWIV